MLGIQGEPHPFPSIVESRAQAGSGNTKILNEHETPTSITRGWQMNLLLLVPRVHASQMLGNIVEAIGR